MADERGYGYDVTEEQILEWMQVPVEEKLRWVEEVTRLAWELRTDEAREIHEKLRRGEI
jgi:hypothetical protein